ncbi:carbon monoxide dehydrogenase subunit g [Streptomyces xiamenensis]|uniref:Carbon monoxide dehydrogenase subunit g n=1 Tax=Streptomyces xiamenensis TaxID=408015 RepID=A0A0F7FWA2_9ACTN|nr:hypothetical protein [Streptomyces xiamenensis]AKG44259.1 carbon monoxide dehydrogenase subunit g [Streptomyces xiamenensis]
MEHEVYVPFSAAVLRSAFADPGRVARCVPGLELDREQPSGPSGEPAASAAGSGAAAEPSTVAGRLRLRIGGTSITYRGTLTVTAPAGTGPLTLTAEGGEARGTGTAALTLTVAPRTLADGSGTTLAFSASVRSEGRLAAIGARQRETAGRRLLDRFLEALVADLGQEEVERGEVPPVSGTGGIGEPGDNERVIPGIPAPRVSRRRRPRTVGRSSRTWRAWRDFRSWRAWRSSTAWRICRISKPWRTWRIWRTWRRRGNAPPAGTARPPRPTSPAGP